MGWAGGTEIFDDVVDLFIYYERLHHGMDITLPPDAIQQIVYDVYSQVDFGDWDTQDESRYFDPYLENVMIDMGEIEVDLDSI
jgi:hypothetical protein